MRNELCFQHTPLKSFRTMILLIISLVHYWSGMLKRQTRELIPSWLPENVDIIPLRIWKPEDTQIISYRYPDEEDADAATAA